MGFYSEQADFLNVTSVRPGVLKVRKPGVDELVRIDLEILEGLKPIVRDALRH